MVDKNKQVTKPADNPKHVAKVPQRDADNRKNADKILVRERDQNQLVDVKKGDMPSQDEVGERLAEEHALVRHPDGTVRDKSGKVIEVHRDDEGLFRNDRNE